MFADGRRLRLLRNVTALATGDSDLDRIERAEALRRTLLEPRDDERGDLKPEEDASARAMRSGAATVAGFYGLTQGVEGWTRGQSGA